MPLPLCFCKNSSNVNNNWNKTKSYCIQNKELRTLKASTIVMKSFFTRHEEYMDQKVLGTNSENFNVRNYSNTKFQIDGATTNNHYLFDKRTTLLLNEEKARKRR